MSIEPIIAYAKARRERLRSVRPEPHNEAANEAAIEELRLIIVLGEGLLKQEAMINRVLLPHTEYRIEDWE